MSKDGKVTALVAAALLLSSLSLGGCMTSTAGSSLMDARAEAPALPKTSVYLPVEDLPPKREKPAMTADERSKLQKELIAVRDRQASDGKARGGAAAPSTHKTLKSGSPLGGQAGVAGKDGLGESAHALEPIDRQKDR
jgi:hypothetical protein